MTQKHQNLTPFNVNVVHGKWLLMINKPDREKH